MKWKIIALLMIITAMSIITTMSFVPDYFEYITEIDMDSEGYLYYINHLNNQVNVVKTDPKGSISHVISFDTIRKGFIYEYPGISTDSDGRLYILERQYEVHSYLVTSEKILRYNKNGKFDKVVYSLDYKDTELRLNSSIDHIDIYAGYIHFFELNENKDSARLVKVSIENQSAQTVGQINLPGDLSPSRIKLSSTEEIIVLNRKAEILKIDRTGGYTKIFPVKDFSENTIPSGLSIDEYNNLYFMDLNTGNKIIINLNTNAARISGLGKENIGTSTDLKYRDLWDIYGFGENRFAAVTGSTSTGKKGLLVMNKEDVYEINKTAPPITNYILRAATIFVILTLIGLALLIIYYLFRRFITRRFSIILKQALILVPLICISMLIINWFTARIYQEVIYNETFAQIYNIALSVYPHVDSEKIKTLNSPEAYKSKEYTELENFISLDLDSYYDMREEPHKRMVYNMLSVVRDDRFYIGVSYSYQCNRPLEYIYDRDTLDLYKKALKEKRIITGSIQDELGKWIVALSPIIDSNGVVVGILETGTNIDDYAATVINSSYKISVINLLVGLAVVLLCLIALYLSLRPLRKLKQAVYSVSEGNYGAQLSLRSNDEISDISKVFNIMSSRLRSHFDELTRLNEAYYRFVPLKFFELLKKKSVLEIKLGDQVKEDLAVMFSNIRDFNNITSRMSTEEIFNYINSAFNLMGNEITRYKGIVNRFDSTGILSLYPNVSENAIKSAISAREKQLAQNSTGDLTADMNFGVVIHKGPIMLGIVGQEKRMSPTAISEHVNLVMNLEKQFHAFGCSILVTESVLNDISAIETYNYRYIGYITLTERNEVIKLYDFFDGDPFEFLSMKKNTKKDFDEGLKLYFNARFHEARNRFIQVLKNNPQDNIAKIYLYKCDEYYKLESQDNWDFCLDRL